MSVAGIGVEPIGATEQDLPAYRRSVWKRHRPWFEYHHRVARALEAAVQTARPYPTHVHLMLDMLMLQGLKSHATVSLLAQHGLMEDTASIARRLMELAVQAAYIGLESDEKERRRRAGRLAAFMWRQLPRRYKHRLPDEVRRMWVGLGRGYGRYVSPKAKRWGPTFFEMFSELGQEQLYRQDYSFLSGLAHGSSDHQVFEFATLPIKLHRDDFVSVLLRYSTRYYLALGLAWNSVFGILDDSDLDELVQGLDQVPDGAAAAGATYECSVTSGTSSAGHYLMPVLEAWAEHERITLFRGTFNLCADRDVVVPVEYEDLEPYGHLLTLETRKNTPGYSPRLYPLRIKGGPSAWLFRWSAAFDLRKFVGDAAGCTAERHCELVSQTSLRNALGVNDGDVVQFDFS